MNELRNEINELNKYLNEINKKGAAMFLMLFYRFRDRYTANGRVPTDSESEYLDHLYGKFLEYDAKVQ